MALQKSHILTIIGFLIFFVVLLAMRTKPTELIEREKTRALNLQSTDVNALKLEASSSLSSNNKARIQILESELAEADEDEKVDIYKDLSSVWYDAGEIGIAGYYAEQIALSLNDAEAWGIAGTTYGICIKRSQKDKERSLCLNKALEAIENAISLAPDQIDYQINKAIILAENPQAENPMRGVKLLLDLNKNFPENVPVINNIARFALQTNQLDKAEQRLLGALSIEPKNRSTNCLLVQLYQAKGEDAKMELYRPNCDL